MKVVYQVMECFDSGVWKKSWEAVPFREATVTVEGDAQVVTALARWLMEMGTDTRKFRMVQVE